jgi:hypothetical protein
MANKEVIGFTGKLSCDHGEGVGTYPIVQNTLNNGNYTITYYGEYLTITLATDDTQIPGGKLELMVYPNPFTDHLTFDLMLETDSKVSLEIYNLNGVKLATVFNEKVQALQNNLIEYRPENLPTGVYFYRVIADGRIIFTGKVIHKE